jgi:hypothetical protein
MINIINNIHIIWTINWEVTVVTAVLKTENQSLLLVVADGYY